MKTTLPLPKGATLLAKPVKKKIAGWNELFYDAKIAAFGVNWYRVQGGFGTQGCWGRPGDYLRDDWVADVPCVTVAVTVKDWHTPAFSDPCEYKTMKAAMLGQLKDGLAVANRKHSKALEDLNDATNAIRELEAAIKRQS